MVTRARASHIGSALSITDIVAVLYGRILRVDPSAPDHPERDRFILSKGHACVAVYAALAETGFFDFRASRNLRNRGIARSWRTSATRCRGPSFRPARWAMALPFGTGQGPRGETPGQGLAHRRADQRRRMGRGKQLGGRAVRRASPLGQPSLHHRLQQAAEPDDRRRDASARAAAFDKFEAFGWAVREVDGHDHEALLDRARCRGLARGQARDADRPHDQGQRRQLHGEPGRVALPQPDAASCSRRRSPKSRRTVHA